VVELEDSGADHVSPRAPPARSTPPKRDLPVKRFASQAAWESWLEKHHASSQGLWVEFGKKGSGVPSMNHAEALESALRFGWIDGQAASVDTKLFRQRFTPRRSRSKWSKINCATVERLRAAGRLAPAGIREMEAAKADGRWAAAYDSPRNIQVPDDLAAELRRRPAAKRFFEQLDSRNRYAILYRLADAKKPETRQRRLEQFVRMLVARETLY
jgi:uncharacterized protein YdeI (YjbR/CyaY-like superfamily)